MICQCCVHSLFLVDLGTPVATGVCFNNADVSSTLHEKLMRIITLSKVAFPDFALFPDFIQLWNQLDGVFTHIVHMQ